MSHPFFYNNPTFSIAYHRFEAPAFNEAFAQIDALQQSLGSEVLIHEEIARMKLHIERPHIHALREVRMADNFTPINHHEIFAPIEEMKARIREAGGWIAFWEKQNNRS